MLKCELPGVLCARAGVSDCRPGLDTGKKSLGVFRLEPHNRAKANGNFASNKQRWTATENFSISMRHINERNGSQPRQRQLAKVSANFLVFFLH
jgi:hypothetical protein